MNPEFEAFIEAIKLTPFQREDAQKKYDGVCSKLHDYFYQSSNYDGSTRFLIGSYGKKTHIQPARDIDVIFIMPPEKFADYNDNQANPQSQLLQKIRSILIEKYQNTPIKAWGKVVKLEFAEPQHDVEVQPAWENDNGTFTIPNSEGNGSWEIVNPRTEIRRIQESEKSTGKTKGLIRTIKKWSEQCTAKVSSYNIEQNVLSFLDSNTNFYNYSTLVKDFLSHFYQVTLDQQLKSHLKTALERATKACEFEGNSEFDKACSEWRKVLGDKFPLSTTKGFGYVIDAKVNELMLKYPSSMEEFIDRKYNYTISINPQYKLSIDTHVPQIDGFRQGGWLSELYSRFPLIKLLKRLKIEFQITEINIPEPYRLYWKIRNFGEEARSASGLRGEITEDTDRGHKQESTLYLGTHLVECYAIKDNTCVAIGRLFVPIGNE